jgi:hypothetical protein
MTEVAIQDACVFPQEAPNQEVTKYDHQENKCYYKDYWELWHKSRLMTND